MEQDNNKATPGDDAESESRRDFLKKLGKASATAPAVGLLLAAGLKSDKAAAGYVGGGSGSGSGSS